MTRTECDICMQKAFPVHVSNHSPLKEFCNEKYYQIISAHKYRHKDDKTWEYSYGISPETTWRSSVTITPHDLVIDEKYSERLKSEVNQTLFKIIKAYIKELLAAGISCSDINSKISAMLEDEKEDRPDE